MHARIRGHLIYIQYIYIYNNTSSISFSRSVYDPMSVRGFTMIGNTSDRWTSHTEVWRVYQLALTRVNTRGNHKQQQQQPPPPHRKSAGRASSKLHKQLLRNDRPRYPAGTYRVCSAEHDELSTGSSPRFFHIYKMLRIDPGTDRRCYVK